MSDRARAVRAAGRLGAALMLLCLARPAAAQEEPQRWEVTVALRLAGGNGKPIAVHVALPPDEAGQDVSDVVAVGRGLKAETVRDGAHPKVVFRGRLRGSRRVAVTYRVGRHAPAQTVPAVTPVEDPPADLVGYLSPAPLFPSRSILVREFLETEVAPMQGGARENILPAIFAAMTRTIKWRRDGKTLVLDTLRRGRAKRIGIERTFTTFLRCARIPARLVEGIDLESATRRKRVFWTEVWAGDRWWPVSASRGWIGARPRSYVALARDGRRVLEVEGPLTASYGVATHRLRGVP